MTRVPIKLEDKHTLDVGGLYGRVKLAEAEASRRSLGKFVQLSRRRLGQSLETLAENAQVDLGELLAIETGRDILHRPETLRLLAAYLSVEPQALLQLAGLRAVENRQLGKAALHFAARTESTKPLEPQEQEALEKFREEAFVGQS